MKTARHALFIALLTGSTIASAQDAAPGAPVVVPTPTFGNENNPPAPMPPASTDAAPPAAAASDAPQAAAKPLEAAIPQTYRDDRYTSTLGKNPFLLKTGAAPTQPTESFAKDWELKFLRETKGMVKAGIQNRQTQQYRTITAEPDAEGFKIVSAKIGRSRKDSTVEVAKGSETATMTFSDAPTGGAPGGRGQPGGIVPGRQVVPQGAPNANMPPGYRPPTTAGAATAGTAQRPTINNAAGMPVPGQQPQNRMQPGVAQPPTVVPGNTNTAPPNPINRRRVLIPAPAPATAPQQ